MAAERSKVNIPIIVAVITVLGSLIVAIINKWDFSSKNKGPSDNTINHFVGNVPTSGVIYFEDSGPPNCQYSVEYTNTVFSIQIDKSSNTVISAVVNTKRSETLMSDCPHGVTGPTNNIYSLKSSNINGSTLTINFDDNSQNFPPTNTSFSGTITQDEIKGTLVFNRTIYPEYTVTIPISAALP